MKRKIKQIISFRAGKNDNDFSQLVALCEDGTLWQLAFLTEDDSEWDWNPIKGIPDIVELNSDSSVSVGNNLPVRKEHE